jgi:hypothetical protein
MTSTQKRVGRTRWRSSQRKIRVEKNFFGGLQVAWSNEREVAGRT